MYSLVRVLSPRTLNKILLCEGRNFRWIRASGSLHSPNIAQKPDFSEESSMMKENQDNVWRLRRKVVCSSPDIFTKTPEGVCFNVAYVDTGAEWPEWRREASPTIVAVHGTPATHNDVLPVIKPFYNKNCRVIALNLPGYQHTSGVSKEDHDQFMHSTAEIAEFLHNFLETVEVEKVDMMVAHSAGTLPSTALTALYDHVRAIMHICPPPGHTLPKAARPFFLIKLLGKVYETRLGKMILKPVIPFVNRQMTGLNTNRPSHLRSVVRYMSNIDFTLLQTVAMETDIKKIPAVFVYSLNDSLVESKHSKDWARKLGFGVENFDEYDKDFNLIKSAIHQEVSDYKKGIILAKGGHFPQFKSRTALPILIKEAEQLLAVSLEKTKNLSED